MTQSGDHTEIVNIAEILYCDDWILLADSEQSLQAMVMIIDRMVKAFGQQLSPSKSSVLVIYPKPPIHPVPHPRILLGDTHLTVVDSAKFLGNTDSTDAKIDLEVEKRILSMRSSFFADKRQLYGCRDISIRARLDMFTSKVVKRGIYACATWNLTTKHIESLEAEYFNLARILLGLPFCRRNKDGTIFLTPPPNSHPVALSRVAIMQYARSRGYNFLPLEAHIYLEQVRYLGHLQRHHDELPYQVWRATTPIHPPHATHGHHQDLPIASHARALTMLGIRLDIWEDDALDRKGWRDHIHKHSIQQFLADWTLRRTTPKRASRPRRRQTNRKTGGVWLAVDSDDEDENDVAEGAAPATSTSSTVHTDPIQTTNPEDIQLQECLEEMDYRWNVDSDDEDTPEETLAYLTALLEEDEHRQAEVPIHYQDTTTPHHRQNTTATIITRIPVTGPTVNLHQNQHPVPSDPFSRPTKPTEPDSATAGDAYPTAANPTHLKPRRSSHYDLRNLPPRTQPQTHTLPQKPQHRSPAHPPNHHLPGVQPTQPQEQPDPHHQPPLLRPARPLPLPTPPSPHPSCPHLPPRQINATYSPQTPTPLPPTVPQPQHNRTSDPPPHSSNTLTRDPVEPHRMTPQSTTARTPHPRYKYTKTSRNRPDKTSRSLHIDPIPP